MLSRDGKRFASGMFVRATQGWLGGNPRLGATCASLCTAAWLGVNPMTKMRKIIVSHLLMEIMVRTVSTYHPKRRY